MNYAAVSRTAHDSRAEAARLERRLSNLVNEAYGLTPEEMDLLWKSATPNAAFLRVIDPCTGIKNTL